MADSGSPSYSPPTVSTLEGEKSAFRARLQSALGPSIQLRGALGRGGFAEVFVAWDTRLKRELAIKTIREDLGTASGLRERFQREAEAVAMLRHPNIIPIYAVGEEEGVAFFTMPRIVGETLAEVLQRDDGIPASAACRIIAEVAGALETAHRAGVIHRDVKPDNIMLEGAEQRTIVMDFGIARTGPPAERGLTGTGMFVGTPEYMSPEQASGERELDGRTDQYSLALVAYRMLAGVRAFESDSQQSSLYKQATTVPPLVSDRNPDVPVAVAEAVQRALNYDPAARFPSIGEFGSAIAAGMGTTTGSGQIQRREKDPVARARAALAAIPHWRHPLVAAGLIGVAAFFALRSSTVAQAGYELGVRGDDAWLASRDWLVAQNVANPVRVYSDVEENNAEYTFLQRTIGRRAADSLYRRDGLGWEWRSYFRDTTGSIWRIDVASGLRVVGFTHVLPDTLSRPSLDQAAATALAARSLPQYGATLDSLVFVGDSSISRGGRTDHFLTWRWKDGTTPGLHADTVTRRIRVGVQGDRVERMHRFLDIPAASRRANARPKWIDWLGLVAPFVVVGVSVFAVVVVVGRQRRDTLQWESGARLLAVALLLALPYNAIDAWRKVALSPDPAGTALSSITQILVLAALGGGVVLCFFVAAESLAAESAPHSFQGVRDVAAGRVLVPEMAVAAIRGALGGAVIVGLTTLIRFAGITWFGARVPASVSGIVQFGVAEAILPVAVALPLAAALMFVARVLVTRGVPWWAACLILGVLGSMMQENESVRHGSMVLATFVAGVGLAVIAMRDGFLAALVAAIVVTGTSQLVALALTPGAGGHATTLGLGFAIVLTPFAMGLAAYRRARAIVPSASS